MTALPGIALLSFAVGVALAVLGGLMALLAQPGERGWGVGGEGRLERLGHPAWALRPLGAGGPAGSGAGAGAGAGPGAGSGAGPGSLELLPGRPLAAAAATFAAGLGGWLLLGGPVAGAVAAIAAMWLLRSRAAARRAALRRRFQDGLEAALETMVASFKAGKGLVQAIEDASREAGAPVSQALRGVLGDYRAGTPLDQALHRLTLAWPFPEVAYLSACLETHLRTGGDVTALLINLGGMVRERRHLVGDLAGRTGEARSTGSLLALLPPALLAYVLWSGPEQVLPLLSSPVGLAAAGYALASWVAGVYVTKRTLDALSREIEEG